MDAIIYNNVSLTTLSIIHKIFSFNKPEMYDFNYPTHIREEVHEKTMEVILLGEFKDHLHFFYEYDSICKIHKKYVAPICFRDHQGSLDTVELSSYTSDTAIHVQFFHKNKIALKVPVYVPHRYLKHEILHNIYQTYDRVGNPIPFKLFEVSQDALVDVKVERYDPEHKLVVCNTVSNNNVMIDVLLSETQFYNLARLKIR